MFTGGLDLAGACAVAGTDDDLATLDLLDALVRKSLLVADRSSGRTRFSMLETIRRFAEAQLVASEGADAARTAHAQYFAGREADVFALWDSPRQREAYTWFGLELANLRSAFRWAADNGDLDSAATIAVYAAFLGVNVEQHEPFGWAEELVGPAEAVDHRRRAQLYFFASTCYYTGRMDDAARYVAAAEVAIECGRYDAIPFDFECAIGGFYAAIGHPERWTALCRKAIARGKGSHIFAKSALVASLAISNRIDEAIEASIGLPEEADGEGNPTRTSFALFVYAVARRYSDPAAAYEAVSRALIIAQESGNRQDESYTSLNLAWLAVTQAHPIDAFDKLALATRIRYDAGSFSLMDSPLAVLTILLDQLEMYEPAARMAGKAMTPMSNHAYPELDIAIEHVRQSLGDETFGSLARAGRGMSNAAMTAYALEQMELARSHLLAEMGGR